MATPSSRTWHASPTGRSGCMPARCTRCWTGCVRPGWSRSNGRRSCSPGCAAAPGGDGGRPEAAAVLGVLVPMLLCAGRARYVLGPYLWAVRLGDEPLGVRPEVWAPLVAWGVVAVLALSGWRVVTATLAWIAGLGEAAMLGPRYL